MKNLSFLLIALTFVVSAPFAFAKSGACSGHDGVSCSAGADVDGSVICTDGWKNSSVSFSSMKMCSTEKKEVVQPTVRSENAVCLKTSKSAYNASLKEVKKAYNAALKEVSQVKDKVAKKAAKKTALAAYNKAKKDVYSQWMTAKGLCK